VRLVPTTGDIRPSGLLPAYRARWEHYLSTDAAGLASTHLRGPVPPSRRTSDPDDEELGFCTMTTWSYRVLTWGYEEGASAPTAITSFPEDAELVAALVLTSPNGSLDVAGALGWEVVEFSTPGLGSSIRLVLRRPRE
jgi:hypothetical protein